jgi:hypothetical protein
MTRKIFTLLLFVAAFVSTQAAIVTIPYCAKAPTVDGYIDDVDEAWGTFVDLSARNPAGTTNAMTAKACLMAGADAFYWAIVVEDATPSNDTVAIPNSYERDCNEIFFSLDTATAGTGAYAAGSWQIRIQRDNSQGNKLVDGEEGINKSAPVDLLTNPKFQAASASSATEWIGEEILPYDALSTGMATPWDKKFFRFECAAADNTTGVAGGRTEQLYWNTLGSGDGGWDDTRALTIYAMPALSSVKALAQGQATAFVSNNVLNVVNVNGMVNVYDIKGTLVSKANIKGSGSIAISNLKAGVYVVKGAGLAQKFVK